MDDNHIEVYEAELAKWQNKNGAEIAEIDRQIEELQQKKAELLAERNKVVKPLTDLIAALSPEGPKPSKITKTKAVRGRRTCKSAMVVIPDNLGKGTKIKMLAGKYSEQEGTISSIIEKNGDRTFFLLLSGGRRTSVKAGSYGKSWKIQD